MQLYVPFSAADCHVGISCLLAMTYWGIRYPHKCHCHSEPVRTLAWESVSIGFILCFHQKGGKEHSQFLPGERFFRPVGQAFFCRCDAAQ